MGSDCFTGGRLRPGPAPFPAIDRGEGNPKPLGELLLGEVEIGADHPQDSGEALIVCYIRHIWNVAYSWDPVNPDLSGSLTSLVQGRRCSTGIEHPKIGPLDPPLLL